MLKKKENNVELHIPFATHDGEKGNNSWGTQLLECELSEVIFISKH